MRAPRFLSGMAVGAGLVYFLDPERGEARRARLEQRLEGALDTMGRRKPGEIHDAAADDQSPVARRYGSRLGDISGLEAAHLPNAGGFRISASSETLIRVAGGILVLYAFARRGRLASVVRTVGAGMLASGTRGWRPTALPAGRDRRRTVDIQKTLHIDAPIGQVYAFWSDYENFPLFMSNVREVRDLGGGRSRWTVKGPGGVPIEWEAVLTEQAPNDRIAWRSEPGSMLENAGVIRFRPEADGTRIDLRFCYQPPAGGAGQAVAELLGSDPRAKLNEDLGRLKALLEATAEG
ncbi:MAG: SRPBCC family protein [Gemmatimonadales bacterium]